MDNLVVIKDNEPVVLSTTIANGMCVEHRSVILLIEKYQNILEKRGKVVFEIRSLKTSKTNQKIRMAWLNKRQFTLLVTLMRNSEQVVDFKDKLEDAFAKQEKIIAQLLAQKTDAQWIQNRSAGKEARKQETDIIQEFVEYAKKQGSVKPEKYYIHFTKATNKALFILEEEYKNIRNILTSHQLQILASADTAVAKAIKEGMERGMQYKDIYVYAKERLEQFAEIVGKFNIPLGDQFTLHEGKTLLH